MVADRVEVVSRRAGADEAWRWSSDGKGTFDLAPAAADTPRGTTITLHLKEDASEFLQEGELRRIVHTYSDHISFPIFLATSGGEEEGAADNQLNAANALWTRPKSEISEEQYKEFYHHVGGMYDDPALTVHYTAEGRQAYTTLLFVPNLPPFDLYDPQRSGHIRLYVKRVFITDDAKLLPSYLRFVRGVVDSEDIPLNISREMLQNNPLMAAMRKAITGKVLNELGKCADNDADKFRGIWQNFGAVLKEGLYEDPERRDALYKLARFETTRSDKPAEAAESETPAAEGEEKKDEAAATKRWRSLTDYVAAMQDGQKAIYYLTGDNREQLLASPQLEGYLARGLEVLLLSDPVDAFWVTTAAGYEGKPFRSITQGSADLAEIPLTEEAAKDKGEEIAADALIDKLKSVLGDEVSDVQKSARLIGSPACLIAPAFAPDRQMEKLMQRQQGGKSGLKPILEINAGHALAHALNDSLAGNKDERFADLAFLLLDEARILEGGTPADPAKFAERLNRLVTGG
jgi:molecular chaperone HtpG